MEHHDPERVIGVIRRIQHRSVADAELEGSVEPIDDATDFAADLRFDSLDILDLVGAIEDEFGIEIPDALIQTVKTVGDLRIALSTVTGGVR